MQYFLSFKKQERLIGLVSFLQMPPRRHPHSVGNSRATKSPQIEVKRSCFFETEEVSCIMIILIKVYISDAAKLGKCKKPRIKCASQENPPSLIHMIILKVDIIKHKTRNTPAPSILRFVYHNGALTYKSQIWAGIPQFTYDAFMLPFNGFSGSLFIILSNSGLHFCGIFSSNKEQNEISSKNSIEMFLCNNSKRVPHGIFQRLQDVFPQLFPSTTIHPPSQFGGKIK